MLSIAVNIFEGQWILRYNTGELESFDVGNNEMTNFPRECTPV